MRFATVVNLRADDVVDFEAPSQMLNFVFLAFLLIAETMPQRSGDPWALGNIPVDDASVTEAFAGSSELHAGELRYGFPVMKGKAHSTTLPN